MEHLETRLRQLENSLLSDLYRQAGSYNTVAYELSRLLTIKAKTL